jgi:drug/metabolite transporter (DMT)-like permease
MYAISGSTIFFGKQLLVFSSPLFLSGLRTLIAGGFFLLYAWRTKKKTKINKDLLFSCIAIAIYSFFLSNTFKFWALQHSSVGHAGAISVLEPLCALSMAYVMFNERATIKQLIGMALCIASGLMMTTSSLSLYDLVSIPSLFLCIAMVSCVYGALLMRRLIKYQEASISLVMGISMSIAGIITLLATITEASSYTVSADSMAPFIGNLMAMILISNIIGYRLYGRLLTRYSVLFISCGSCIRPIFTALYQWAFFNQPPTVEFLAYAGIILIGLLLIDRGENTITQAQKYVSHF